MGVVEWRVLYQALDSNYVQGFWESSRSNWEWGLWSQARLVWLRVRGDVVPWLPGLRDRQSVRCHRWLPESGMMHLIHQLVSYQMSLQGYVTRGVRLSSNGLSSSGRCCGKDSLGTSDLQEPLRTCELQCHLSFKLIPFQWAVQGGCFLCGRMRGVLYPMSPLKLISKNFKVDSIVICEQ